MAVVSGDLRVLARTAYPPVAAGARVRVIEMADHLREFGVQLQFRASLSDEEYRLISEPSMPPRKLLALVRGSARASRPSKVPTETLTLVYRLGSLMPALDDLVRPVDIYDFDDAIYLSQLRAHHAAASWIKQESKRAIRNIRRARLVFAGNTVLAGFASEHARRVEVVPSCVNPLEQPARSHAAAEIFTVGWTGSPTTSPYLRPAVEAVEALREQGAAIRLVLMGADPHPSLQAPWIEHRPWSLEGEKHLLTELDVGLMPMPDNAWTRGKCGYKVLRYFAAGLPVVASPVGVNRQLIADGRGIPASTSREFHRALSQLATDHVARSEMGDLGRRFVERDYSYQVWAPRVAALLRELHQH